MVAFCPVSSSSSSVQPLRKLTVSKESLSPEQGNNECKTIYYGRMQNGLADSASLTGVVILYNMN